MRSRTERPLTSFRSAARALCVSAALGWCAAPQAGASCVSSSTTWRGAAFEPQSAPFTATFEAVPGGAGIDGVIGLSSGPVAGYSDLAAIVRFNNSGHIDARDGGAYGSAAPIPYIAGATYRFRVAVDPGARRYSVYVEPPGAEEKAVAENFAFRAEQASLSSLGRWAAVSRGGPLSVCRFELGASARKAGGAPCLEASTRWRSVPMPARKAAFSARFTATPAAGGIDGVTGLSLGPVSGFDGLAAAVRFNSAGLIDARNAGAYAADTRVPYTAGAAYAFRLTVDPANGRYWVYVAPPGGEEALLAANYAFRTELRSVGSLDHWALHGAAGRHKVCGFALSGGASSGPDTAPPSVKITAPAPGAAVTGSVAVSAAASDDVAVAGVQFQLDGAKLGPEDLQPPYAASWNTVAASSGAHTLTATARDAAGNRGSASITVTIGGAAPVPASLDRFGVRKLYATFEGGTDWASSWDNGSPRSFRGRDPQDAWFDADHGRASYSVDGKGLFRITGAVPRMYIHDPERRKSWRNVEMTVYAQRIADGDTAYAGIVGVARSNHGTTGPEKQDLCDTRGSGARFRYDGHIDFEKETSHPNSVPTQNKAVWSRLPYKTWIGYKLVVYDLPNGNVKLESWMDLTDGARGGTWTKVNELEDTGRNFGVGGRPCREGIDPALPLTAAGERAGSESGKPNIAVYWRSDDVGADGLIYKKMSVREISAP